MTTILFLDIDGVLNNKPKLNFWMDNGVKQDDRICNGLVDNLNCILDNTKDVKIIISSTWRVSMPHPMLANHLTNFGFRFSHLIVGDIADNNKSRFAQMQDMLDDIHHDDFIIIDDVDPGFPKIPSFQKLKDNHFFHIDPDHGLTIDVAKRIIKRINK